MRYVSEQCKCCKHLIRGLIKQKAPRCAAFRRVPDDILSGEHDHTKPYEGDNGIRFEPLDEGEEE